MRRKSPAIFLVATLVLAGGAALRVIELFTMGVVGDLALGGRLSGLVGMFAVMCGVAGSVRALRENRVRNPWLHAWSWLYCVSLGYASALETWQPLTASFAIGETLRVGPNFVGIALLCWYYSVATRTDPIVAAPREHAAMQSPGIV